MFCNVLAPLQSFPRVRPPSTDSHVLSSSLWPSCLLSIHVSDLFRSQSPYRLVMFCSRRLYYRLRFREGGTTHEWMPAVGAISKRQGTCRLLKNTSKKGPLSSHGYHLGRARGIYVSHSALWLTTVINSMQIKSNKLCAKYACQRHTFHCFIKRRPFGLCW